MKAKAKTNDDGEAYQVVVPPELARRWDALTERDHRLLAGRLRRAACLARSAPAVWPAGPVGRNRGRHRAVVADMWVLYRLDDAHGTVNLIGFGRVLPRAEPA